MPSRPTQTARRAWIPLVGASASDVKALQMALRMFGLSSLDDSHLRPISAEGGSQALWPEATETPVAAFFVISDPLQTASDLARAGGVERPRALALWERYQRRVLSGLRGLPVFVTSRADALTDPAGWSDAIRGVPVAPRRAGARRDRRRLRSRKCSGRRTTA